MSVFLQVFCWFALAITALGTTTFLGMGRSASAGDGGAVALAAIAAPILITVLLVLVQRVRKGRLNQFLSVVDGALGLLLTGYGAYFAVTDPANRVWYIWPLVLGLGLLFLAFESKAGRDD
ncbi:hypothetical protein N9C96_02480 [bacterium]|nr:hypothetical protein [bacterium]